MSRSPNKRETFNPCACSTNLRNKNTSPANTNDWTITLCIFGSAGSNKRILSSLEDRYVYEYINDERQVIRTLIETKTLLSQRQLQNEDIYTITSEIVLSCAENEIDISVRREIDHYIINIYLQLSYALLEFDEVHIDFVHYLGESVRKDYSDQVTYVISHANIGEKYLVKSFLFSYEDI
ncbi:unnamed protein product [Rotaria sp. Silwood2]|nr:unnamed protein product [Rotaria sp. Silwood2]